MRRFWNLLIVVMMFLSLGMATLPRPCQGDGHGGACQAEACQCVASCTCHRDHDAELAAAASCCHVPTALASCHGPQKPPHLSLPERDWNAPPPVAFALSVRFAIAPSVIVPWGTARGATRALAPPEKPPRPFC